MSTTVQDKITQIDDIYTNAYSNATKLSWINAVEALFFTQYVQKWAKSSITSVAGQNSYSYPSGVTWEGLWDEIIYNNYIYKKVDTRWNENDYSYYFYDDDSKINIYPAPYTSGESISVNYLYAPTKKLIGNISSDVLLIPDAFNEAYEYYCIYRMKQVNQEDDAVNWYDLFNAKMKEYADLYKSNTPTAPPQSVLSMY